MRFLRQGISLTAFGDKTMEGIFKKIAEIHGTYKRTFGDRLQECSIISTYKEHASVETSNRYFTAQGDANDNKICKLGEEVDPCGHLSSLTGSDFVHMADNKVYYYKCRKTGKGNTCKAIRVRDKRLD